MFKVSMIANGGLASGITSRVMGGRFWDGFRMGVITAGLNHVAHDFVKGGPGDPPKNVKRGNDCPKCWWLKNDGKITIEEGIWHWRLGEGKPLFTRLASLDLSKIRVSDFDNPDGYHQGYPVKYINFDLDHYTNPEQAVLYGHVAFVYLGKNRVMALADTYDFDIKPIQNYKTVLRNFGTMLGNLYNWYGKPYQIIFTGTAEIKN